MPLDAQLRAVLGYLQDLGYLELYRPEHVAGAGEQRRQAGGRATGPRSAAPGDAPDRRARLGELARTAAGCTACKLHRGRTHVVFGSGHPNAELMFIGEGPGASEDRAGLPFVGAAGELLTRIIRAIELERDDVYIANVVKCRPPDNRDPEPDEITACRPYLEGQIDCVSPRVIVALGRAAAHTLLHTEASISRLRGQWHEVRGIPTRVTYHPAALLRDAALKRPVWEDMQAVRDRLRREG